MQVVKDFHCPDKRTIRQSNGHVFLFCKIEGTAEALELPTHNLWYFNSYDIDEAFDAYFANPRKVRPPTVYIGFPCTKDITWKKRFPKISNCILIRYVLFCFWCGIRGLLLRLFYRGNSIFSVFQRRFMGVV